MSAHIPNPNSYLPLEGDLPFLEPSTSFGLLRVWQKYRRDNLLATFDLYVRELPNNRNFLIFTGLEEMVSNLLNWHYADSHLQTLRQHGFLDNETEKFLKSFTFTGSVYAMREGSIFFASEPVVKVVAPLAQAALLYNFLVNTLCSNSIFSSKCVRTRFAASGKKLITGAIRGHAHESILKYMRSAYIAGFDLVVAPVFEDKYKVKFEKLLKGTHHHYIKSFPSELEAMRAIVETFPDFEVTLVVDTYDVAQGIENAIKICEILKKKQKGIHSIFIDSGDLAAQACFARKRLDEAGFPDVKIVAASDLDEWKIDKLLKANAPIDVYMLATELVTSADAPKLEAVYKLSQILENGISRPTFKLSPGKVSLPGSKQVYRFYGGNNRMKGDIIGLEGEEVTGEKLLIPIIEGGNLIYSLPSISVVRRYCMAELDRLPADLRRLEVQKPYAVQLSPALEKLSQNLADKRLLHELEEE